MKGDRDEPLRFNARSAWRRWLSANHSRDEGAYVLLAKKGAARRGLRYAEALEEALCFGWIDSVGRGVDDETFVLRFTPRRKGSVWSALNKARVERLAAEGRMASPGLAAVEAAKASGEWDAERGTAKPIGTPAELREALDADADARREFERLAPSHRAMYSRWVADGKKPETRARRAARVAELAKRGERPGIGTRISDRGLSAPAEEPARRELRRRRGR